MLNLKGKYFLQFDTIDPKTGEEFAKPQLSKQGIVIEEDDAYVLLGYLSFFDGSLTYSVVGTRSTLAYGDFRFYSSDDADSFDRAATKAYNEICDDGE